jgi:cation diffusion facilitator CzcD-associated flavoprotein CzcO
VPRRGDTSFGPQRTPKIAIIGGGWGGIAAAVKLKKAGIHTFTVFDRNEGPGGVWYDNTFPGLMVDVPSRLYSFSFRTVYDWRRTHATRADNLAYTAAIMDEYGLDAHFRAGMDVERVVWDDATHTYTLEFADGTTHECHVVISAVGVFNTPKYPTWPGLETFQGVKFHASRWEPEHDLKGKRIAFVGTGATCIQVVPEIAPDAEKVYVFQRDPGWALPRGDRDLTPAERTRLTRQPWRQRWARLAMYWQFERLIFGMRRTRERKGKVQIRAEEHLEAVLGDRPDIKALVTPTHPFGGKRPLFENGFYESLKRDNVELVPRAVTRVTETAVVDAQGDEHEVDVLLMGTGYRVSEFLCCMEVVGRNGRTLEETWQGNPVAFVGTTVSGFPNFYILYGPNTNGGGSLAVQLEREAEYAVGAIKRMIRDGVTALEVRPLAYRLWDRYIDWRNSQMVYADAPNYYKAASGKVVTEWPGTLTFYWLLTKSLRRVAMKPSRRAVTSVRVEPAPAPAVEQPEPQGATV